MSHRKAQIESAIKRAISQVLIEEMSDPRVLGMISVTKVEVTDELREAFVFVSVMPEKLAKKTVAGLVHAQGFIQGRMNKHLSMHHPPRIAFRLDTAFQKQNKALAALSRLAIKEKAMQAQAEGSQDDKTPEPDSSDGQDSGSSAS